MTSKKKKRKRLRFIVKLSLSLIYILIAGVLCLVSFRLYEQDQKIVKWKDVDKTSQYSYIEISEMSEAFAEIKGENKTVHFVIEKESTGAWHTYLIAIKKDDYDKYKKLIDYTYERTEEKVDSIKVYGYPVLISEDIKNLAIKNIENFVPIENQIVLDQNNFEQYMTNTYLDTTKEETHQFNNIILILLIMALVLVILLIFTIFDKDKIVDEVDEIIEKEEKKLKKKKKKQKNKKKSNNNLKEEPKTKPEKKKSSKQTVNKEQTTKKEKNTKQATPKKTENKTKETKKEIDDIEIL
jgi:hypothetical protein